MIFASDNWAGVHPAVSAALSETAGGFDSAYGSGAWDSRVSALFNLIFERDVAVFFVATGTAANALALASAARPGGVIFSSTEAHILTDEAGGPEFMSGGNRVRGVSGPPGKINPAALKAAMAHFDGGPVHYGQPAAVSVTQATEMGTVYSRDEIAALAEIAHARSLPLHMDGARFANGLAALGCTPAEMTWKSGVDMLSFGGTKNGCWCAEAVLFFDPAKAKEFPFMRMRAGQLFSKSRFVGAQFEAYLTDDLWLNSARHANAMARQLADALTASGSARLPWRPDANEVFPIMSTATAKRLKNAGAVFYEWDLPEGFDSELDEDERMHRFVTSFATTEADIARVETALRG